MTTMAIPNNPKTEFVSYEATRKLSKQLLERREELGLKQTDVAAQTGLSQQDISNSERLNPLTSMRFYNFFVLLRFYGIEPNEAASVLNLYGNGDQTT